MGSPSAPSAPNPAASYAKEIQTTLQYAPQLIGAEDAFRGTEDPTRVLQQLQLQDTFGPTQYAQQLAAQAQLDPYGVGVRNQLGSGISNQVATPENQALYSRMGSRIGSDLASGYNLPPDLAQQLNTEIRQQGARGGSLLGNAPLSAEELFKGQAAIGLEQSHLNNAANYLNITSPTQRSFDNAGQFLGLSTPEQAISTIAPVTPDRSSSYINPNVGLIGQQLGQSQFANQAALYAAQGNPWARAVSGAAQGAAAGGGGWGSVALGAAGGAAGYYSDRRLKTDIMLVGTSPSGLNIYEFQYNVFEGAAAFRCRGVIAQEVMEVCPEAVNETAEGWLMVDYGKLDVPFEILHEKAEVT